MESKYNNEKSKKSHHSKSKCDNEKTYIDHNESHFESTWENSSSSNYNEDSSSSDCEENSDEDYEEISDSDCSDSEDNIENLINTLYSDSSIIIHNIAKIFYFMYPKLFVFDTQSHKNNKGIWFIKNKFDHYNKHSDMLQAKLLLSTDIYKLLKKNFNNRLNSLNSKLKVNGMTKTKSLKKKLNKKWESIKSKLSNSKRQIIEELKIFYCQEKCAEYDFGVNEMGYSNENIVDFLQANFKKSNGKDVFVSVADMREFRNANDIFSGISNKRFNLLIYQIFKLKQCQKGAQNIRGWRGLKIL